MNNPANIPYWARTLIEATRPGTPLARLQLAAEQAAKHLPPWPEQELTLDSRTAQATAHHEILSFAESSLELARLILDSPFEIPAHVTEYAVALVVASTEILAAEIGDDDGVTAPSRG